MSKPIMIRMSGVAGSGKSSRAKELARQYDAMLLSSDMIRKELFGEGYVYDAKDNKVVFDKMNELIEECAVNKRNIVIDSTNITRSFRIMDYLELKEKFKVIIYQLDLELEELLLRNKTRDINSRVPDKVVKGMYSKLEKPIKDVDCDEFIIEKIRVVRS